MNKRWDLVTWALLLVNNFKHVFSTPTLPVYLGAVMSPCDYNTLLWGKEKEEEEKRAFSENFLQFHPQN